MGRDMGIQNIFRPTVRSRRGDGASVMVWVGMTGPVIGSQSCSMGKQGVCVTWGRVGRGTGRIVRSSSMGNGRGGGRSVSVNIHGATICPQPFETSTHPIVTARDRIPHHLSAKRARTVDYYIL